MGVLEVDVEVLEVGNEVLEDDEVRIEVLEVNVEVLVSIKVELRFNKVFAEFSERSYVEGISDVLETVVTSGTVDDLLEDVGLLEVLEEVNGLFLVLEIVITVDDVKGLTVVVVKVDKIVLDDVLELPHALFGTDSIVALSFAMRAFNDDWLFKIAFVVVTGVVVVIFVVDVTFNNSISLPSAVR